MLKLKNIKSKKKYFIPVIIIVFVGILALVLSQFEGLGLNAKGIPVTLGTVEKMDVRSEISIKGVVEGEKQAKLSATGGYQITNLLVKEGDLVMEGQLLAKLKADSGNMGTGQSNIEAARLEYSAAKELYAQGAISRSDYLKAKGAYETASSSSANTRITSPFSGTVTRVNGVIGSFTESGTPLIVIEDLSSLKMEVLISEYDIGSVKVGQKAVISADVIGEEQLQGTVIHVSPTGQPKDASSKEMVIPITISIEKGASNLISGVTAKAKIIIEEAKGVLAVPVEAILEDPDTKDSYIFVLLEESILKKVRVTLGVEGNFNIELRKAKLKVGTQVVLSPTADLKEGTMVYDPKLILEDLK